MTGATVESDQVDLATTSLRLDRIMGCRAVLTVTTGEPGADRALAAGADRLQALERRWSRFLPNSDISRLNRSGGRPVTVDASTITLITAMAAGARATDGAFDPTLLVALVGLGYGPSWSLPVSDAAATGHERSRWIDTTLVDIDGATVALADDVQLDPGAIGKGLAADIVADELIEHGAVAARVVIGGDLRVTGPSVVGVSGPDRRPIDRIDIAGGGVATSGTSRRWIAPDGRCVHHAIDPWSRQPVARPGARDVVQATIAAASAAHAEVHATAVLVDPSNQRIEALDDAGVGVLVVDRRGDARGNRTWHRLRRLADETGGAA